MNFNLTNVVVFTVGAILVYSAVKNKSPKDVVKMALAPTQGATAKPKATTPPPQFHGGGRVAPDYLPGYQVTSP